MPKNIVIFSDGTGQHSGLFFDESRSNIYKLYRATRCGPDTAIDPAEQLAFYDPGIGTKLIGGNFFTYLYNFIYNIISQATGLGLTRNVIECYAAIIRMWEPGDRIFLFGFSRGAYTIRCLGGVLALCGIPTHMPDGKPLLRDLKTSMRIAKKAVTQIYQHTASVSQKNATVRKKELLKQRTLLAERFRKTYGSGDDCESMVVPYFIGVFDTVASLANPIVMAVLGILVLALLSGAAGLLSLWSLTWITWAGCLSVGAIVICICWYLMAHLKIPGALPGFSPWKTVTFTEWRMKFYDTTLDERVRYARHAISIDEDRKTFPRVIWGALSSSNEPDENGINWFEQFWFAGNHADIGGGYPENEARLSDVALKWMLDAATNVGLKYDPHYMRLYPDPTGPQHDERRKLLFRYGGVEQRKILAIATLHPSVEERFAAPAVLHYDEMKPYRPRALRGHEKISHWFV